MTWGPDVLDIPQQPFVGATTLTPDATIAPPYLWLDANQDDANLNDNDAVATAKDFSGNGRDLTQGTAANRPTFKTNIINGLPVYRFDGTNDSLIRAAVELSTFVIIAVIRGTVAGRMIYEHSADVNTNPGSFMYTTVGSSSAVNRGGVKSGRDFSTGWAAQNQWGIATHMFRGEHSTHFLWWNNVRWNTATAPFGAADPGTAAVTDTLNLGSRNQASLFFNGDIAEFIIYTPAPTLTEEIAAVLNHLMSKYGL